MIYIKPHYFIKFTQLQDVLSALRTEIGRKRIIWGISGQEVKSQVWISLSLGEILNSTPSVGKGVYLTSYCEQLTGKIKFTNLKVPNFLQSVELDSLINSFIWATFQMLRRAIFQICNFVFQNILPWSNPSRKISDWYCLFSGNISLFLKFVLLPQLGHGRSRKEHKQNAPCLDPSSSFLKGGNEVILRLFIIPLVVQPLCLVYDLLPVKLYQYNLRCCSRVDSDRPFPVGTAKCTARHVLT